MPLPLHVVRGVSNPRITPMRTLLLSLAATTMLGLGLAADPAIAAPVGPVTLDSGPSGVTQAQMSRRQTAQRRRAMLQRPMRRSAGPGDPNSRNPNLPPGQQNSGQSSGGPRR